MKLDEFDLRILVALQRNGRITKLHLAEEIGLSPSPCWERLRRLEQAGVIRGYHADLALDRIVKASVLFVEVTLRAHQAQDFMRFEQAIQTMPEIVECHATGGGFDYLMRVVSTDIDHYQRFMDGLLAADIGIFRYFTYIVTKPVKRFAGYPIQSLVQMAQESTAPAEKRRRNS